jgi:hypothetical protein
MASKPPQIKKLGQSSQYIRCAIVAGHGFGKTTFAASAPNALFAMSDREGAESPKSLGIGVNNDEWRITHADKGEYSLQALYDYMLGGGCDQYEWLVHDNASVENRLCMRSAMEIMRGRPGNKQDIYTPDKPQYQRSQNQFLEMVEMFYDLPINQIWLVHPRVMYLQDDPEGESKEVITAAVQNDQIAESFLGMMPIVGMGTDIEREVEGGQTEHKRRLYFSHRGMYRGKDRTNALGKFRDDLDVPRMLRLIEAKRAGKVTRPVKKAAPARRRRTANT